jgi:SH3-like domain-containing protein
VHKSMLSGKRMASVAVARARILNGPNSKALVTAFVEEGVVVRLNGCEPEWCHVSINSHDVEGWIPRAALWGLHPGETVER